MFNRNQLTHSSVPQNTSVAAMLEQSRDFDADKSDFGPDYKPGFAPNGKLFMAQGESEVGPFSMSDHALTQLCARLGKGTFGSDNYKSLPREAFGIWLNDEEYAPHAAGLLNDHIARVNKKHFIRTYKNEARAVLSDRYAAVQNTEILERVQEAIGLLGQSAGRTLTEQVFRSSITPDSMYLRFRFLGTDVRPQNETTSYGFGLMISNDEVGKGRIKANPCLWRGSCDNSMHFDDEGISVNVRHIGERQLLAQDIALVIGHAIKLGGEYLNRFLQSKSIEIPDIFGTISKMAENEEWSTEFTDAVRDGTEGQRNLYGLLNGITWAAHTVYGEDQEQMTAFEFKAGRMLMGKEAVVVPAGYREE